MSSMGEVDHPLCKECSDQLVESLEDDLLDAEQELNYYREFLARSQEEDADPRDSALEREELQKLRFEEAGLQQRVFQLETDREIASQELASLTVQQAEVDRDSEVYWKEYSEFQRQLREFLEEHDCIEMRLQNASASLSRLNKTNIYNDTFHIWFEGHFGTINGFRLGRLQNSPVDWAEINAAWGQTALLLQSMAERLKFTFNKYRIVPLGSYTRIENVEDETRFEL
ncbi:beclin, variant [Capsaspora owczarzaki ATCC 30864]|nr:beclin, variant [Capsaspora owczarzaki ATCC 30864]